MSNSFAAVVIACYICFCFPTKAQNPNVSPISGDENPLNNISETQTSAVYSGSWATGKTKALFLCIVTLPRLPSLGRP